MEEEERPRKLPKLGHDDTQNDVSPDNGGLYMSGALLGDGNGSPARNGDEDEFGDEESARDDDEETRSNADAPATSNTANDGEQCTQGLSRNQLRRLRRREQWEAGRDYRKAKRKEKLLQKRERKKAEREEAKQNPDAAADLKQKNVERNRRSTLLPLTFVLDCGFDELMHEKERISLAAQLTRSYSDNSKAPYRAHMVVSSFDKLLKERFDTVLGKTHENWKGIRFMQEDFVHAAELAKNWMKEPSKSAAGTQMVGAFADHPDATPEDGEIVYLSSDSPDTLTELKPYSTYIIGGLVDKNRHKGICYKRAAERGIKTAKLPIGEYIQMAARSVLATNHVIEIMVRWLELGDWGKAFMKVIPKRKGGTLKQSAEYGKTSKGQEDGQDAGEPNSDDGTARGEGNGGTTGAPENE